MWGESCTFAADLCRKGSDKWAHMQCSDGDASPPDGTLNNSKTNMYVIAEIQGQQFKVEEGKKLYVHHMQNVETGQAVEIEKVLLADNDGVVTVGTPTVEGAKVVLEVLVPLIKGDKVLVFHKRRRKGYRKMRGYRDQFTQVLVKSVVA